MSSTGFQQIRRRTSAQTHINALIKEFNRFQAEQIQVDNPDFITNNRLTHARLTYHDPFITHKVKSVTTQFYLPFEPDANFVRILCKLDHNGRYAEDSSGFGNHGRFINNPVMKQGLDLGYGESLYPFFNGLDMWVYWLGNPNLDAEQIGVGATFTCRIYPEAIDDTDPDINTQRWRTLISKADDDTEQDGYRVALVPDGSIRFTFARGGVKHTIQSDPGIINIIDAGQGYDGTGFDSTGFSVDPEEAGYSGTGYSPDGFSHLSSANIKPYDYFLTFTIDVRTVTPVLDMTINNVHYNSITSNHLNLINLDPNHRLRLGTLTPFLFDGFYKFKGGIQDFRFYKELILTNDQIDNLFKNRWTINDIPEGHVAFAGYTAVLSTAEGDGGFDTPGFESNGFEVNP